MLWVVFFLFFFIVLAVAFIGKVLLSNSTDITGQNAFTLIIAPTHGGHVTLFGVQHRVLYLLWNAAAPDLPMDDPLNFVNQSDHFLSDFYQTYCGKSKRK